MHRQSSIPFNQSGIGVRAITMTAKTAPANAAAPITAAVFLLRFFFTALQISMAQTTQTAATASAITSVSHNHESSYNILIRSPYLSLANWKLLFHIHAFVKFRFIQLRQLKFYSLSFKRLFTLSTGNLSSMSIISNKFRGNSFSPIRVRYSLTALRSIIIFP